MLANVKIEQDKENKQIHRMFVDGEKLKRVNHIDLNIDVAEVPQVNVGIVADVILKEWLTFILIILPIR